MTADLGQIEVRPVDADRWADLVTLFGPSGAYSGCWCMWWRVPGGEFSLNGNAGNREALHALVHQGRQVGLLGYVEHEPVGWCAVAPRPAYGRVLRSPALRPADPADPAVWSVPCFYIARARRGARVAEAMLAAAIRHAAGEGAAAIEGYPVDRDGGRPLAAAELYTGTVGMFARAGFVTVARPPTGRRVIMRRDLTVPFAAPPSRSA